MMEAYLFGGRCFLLAFDLTIHKHLGWPNSLGNDVGRHPVSCRRFRHVHGKQPFLTQQYRNCLTNWPCIECFDDLCRYGSGQQGWHGIADLPESMPLGHVKTKPVRIGVQPGSLSEEAGLKPGDVIQEVDRKPAATVEVLRQAVNQAGNRTLLLTIVRERSHLFVVLDLSDQGKP